MKIELILGDCLKKVKDIPDNTVDLTVTSPPYDSLRAYNGNNTLWGEHVWKQVARDLFRVTKPGGVVVWVVGDETKNFCESLSSFKQAIFFVEEVGFNLLDTMIYEKKGGPAPYPNMRRYSPWFEYMFVFSKGKPKTFNQIKDKETKSGSGKRNSGNSARQKDGSTKSSGGYITKKYTSRHNVWAYHVGMNKDTTDKIAMSFPARFPELLARDHIISWSNEGDTVFDPFMGSGTTGKMAKLLKRNFIGIEIDPEYFDISSKRISGAN